MATEKKLKASLVIGATLSNSFKMALGSAKGSLNNLGKSIQSLTKQQTELGKAIQTFGRMGKNVDGMRSRYATLATQLEKAKAAQARLNTAQERYNKLTGIGTKVGMAGLGAGAAGAAIGLPVLGALNAAKSYQTQVARLTALGLGRAVTDSAIGFSSQLKTFGTSKAQNLDLMTDALSIFGNADEAKMTLPMLSKMMFSNKALFGDQQGEANADAFMNMMKVIELRGGTSSESEFNKQANMIQQVINATGGKVTAEDWRDAISTGGIAVKGMTDSAFYYGMEPLIQEMGGHRVGTALMSSYNGLYQGHTTKRAAENLLALGLISDKHKVQFDKSGQVSFLNPGALKGSDLYRTDPYEWMKTVLLPTLAAHHITQKDKVLDAIGAIFSNRTASNLFGTMYLQQQQIDRRRKQNASAQNVDQMNNEAQATAAGKEAQAEAKLADLKLRLGTDIIPLYTRALTMATGALEKLNALTAQHPRLAKYMMVGLAGLGASLAVLGPVLVTVGGGFFAVAGASLAFTKTAIAVPMAIRAIGSSLALLMTPAGLVIGAIAAIGVGAFLIWKYWKPIKAFFIDLWGGVKTEFQTVATWIEMRLNQLGSKITQFTTVVSKPFKAVENAGGWVGDKWHDFTKWATGGGNYYTPPASAAATGAGGGQTNHYQVDKVEIHAAPGQDGGKLWDEMQKRIDQKAGGSSSMYDSAFGFGT